MRDHVAVMGNMDGVHRGHQILIAQAADLARTQNRALGAVIFDPHPRQVFAPDGPAFLLTSLTQKIALLGAHGVETVFILPFNPSLSNLTPEQFVHEILIKTLGLAGVVVGEDFRFGKKRSGTAQMLQQLCHAQNLPTKTVTPVALDGYGEKFSSSQARQALREGNPQLAAQVLGRPWSIRGVVTEGKKLGRTLNFPTANISIGNLLPPAKGVYAVTVQHQGQTYKGVANFGNRPTVDGQSLLLEVHIFDFSHDIYDQEIEISLQYFLRPEKKFPNLEALKAAITLDCDKAAKLLA